MARNRGYSLVEWAVIFAIVSAGVIFYISPAKRAITSKTMGVTDHLMWGLWDDRVQQDGGRNYNQIDPAVITYQNRQDTELIERDAKIQSKIDASGETTSYYHTY